MKMKIVKENVVYSISDKHIQENTDLGLFLKFHENSAIPKKILEDAWKQVHGKKQVKQKESKEAEI